MGLINKFENFRYIVTDGVAYNVAAANNLRENYTKLIHISCDIHMIARISSKNVYTEIGAISLVIHEKKCLKNVLVVLKGGEKFEKNREKVGLLFLFHVLPDGARYINDIGYLQNRVWRKLSIQRL